MQGFEKPARVILGMSEKRTIPTMPGIIAKTMSRDLQEMPITDSNGLLRSPHPFD
jgi:hypothetical protein